MLAAALVNAAGLAAQEAFVCAARFVTPVTVIVHEAVGEVIVTAEKAIESGAPCVTTLEPEHPAPKLTVGVAEVKRRLAGRLSVKAIPVCVGFDPVFAIVKTSVVLPLSAIETAPNAFVSVGCAAFTTRQLAATAFVTLVTPLRLAAAARGVHLAAQALAEALALHEGQVLGREAAGGREPQPPSRLVPQQHPGRAEAQAGQQPLEGRVEDVVDIFLLVVSGRQVGQYGELALAPHYGLLEGFEPFGMAPARFGRHETFLRQVLRHLRTW
jgi:hypothetical protein